MGYNQGSGTRTVQGQSLSQDPPIIHWFRNDLRLEDNPALDFAARNAPAVIPVYIWSPDEEGSWPLGAASRVWLHQSLSKLDRSLRDLGSRLIIRRGPVLKTLRALIKESSARGVVWNRRYEPDIVEREKLIKSELRGVGLEVESFNSLLLFEPWEVSTKDGSPYRVYTPYSKNCFAKGVTRKLYPQPELVSPAVVQTLTVEELDLLPKVDWAGGIEESWTPGEVGAKAALGSFLENIVLSYDTERNSPDRPGTSRLSPHLHFGEIGPVQIWHALNDLDVADDQPGVLTYRKELLWREFGYHLLHYYPFTAFEPLRSEFKRFPWEMNRKLLRAWQCGRTGYPIVDAGMRELWHTGWMHNRVRMIVASFLVKDLLIPWQEGAKWFWETLVDADLASNTFGWQWTTGCGADAAPYFRIFNPTAQGEKFDPNGDYVRRWVPELAKLPAKYIHSPWTAPPVELREAGIELGKDYPEPIVDHSYARGRALEAFESIKAPAAAS